MSKNNVTKHWATFPKFTDKELVGIAARGKSVLDYSDCDRERMLNSGMFVVCWDGPMKPEHADLKLGALCGLTKCNCGSWEFAVRLENGETFRCGNAALLDIDSIPYVVSAHRPGTPQGCEAIGRLVGFVERCDKKIYGYLRSETTGNIICVKKDCLAFVSDIKFGL